jgi:hypothetical protein
MRAREEVQEGGNMLRHSNSVHSLWGAAKPIGAEYHVQRPQHKSELVPQLQSSTWSNHKVRKACSVEHRLGHPC